MEKDAEQAQEILSKQKEKRKQKRGMYVSHVIP